MIKSFLIKVIFFLSYENNLENYDKVEFDKETPMKSQRLTKIKKENEGLRKKEKSFVAEINRLKKDLDIVKKETREIRAQKAAENLEKTELKEFFLNCIEIRYWCWEEVESNRWHQSKI